MTKGTKAFRIVICILLGLTMLFSAFFAALFVLYLEKSVIGEEYGISVAGVNVTQDNADDILGDGTVFYSEALNTLYFNNAEIAYDDTIVYSQIDLMIELIGENKFVMSGEYTTAIHASAYVLTKDLAILGDGSLTIEFDGEGENAMGIFAKDLRIETDVTITLPDCTSIANGIYCETFLTVTNGATVTLNNGAGEYSTAVKARNDINIETGSALNVSVNPGTTGNCRALTVGGSLVVWDNASLNVTVDDTAARMSECINVGGRLYVRPGASLTASSKKAYAIECYGSIELCDGVSVSASSEGEATDLFCYGAIVNHGATINGEVEALGGIYSK